MVITKRLRGTWHAWHFQFALGLVVKVLCGHFCIACLRPLTRRYVISRYLPMNILFVCSRNKLRSPTGEAVFANSSDMEVRSAGISNDAQVPVSVEDVEWADVIFVMEQSQKSKLIKKFRGQINRQRIICLGIPDIYKYMDPELVEIFKRKVPQYF